jgi:hypothetical protein
MIDDKQKERDRPPYIQSVWNMQKEKESNKRTNITGRWTDWRRKRER